jgi:predicted metal-dependent phosphoesterase TrpH
MNFDLHVHTTLSPCSRLTIEEIVNHAGELGLDGVCITDHDTMDICHSLREGIQDNGLCVIFGMEYTTAAGDFLLFGPYEDLPLGLPARLLLSHVDMTNGVAVAAHPFRPGRSTHSFVLEERLCRIVEGTNGRNSATANQAAWKWCQEDGGPAMVSGSDAHSLSELGKCPTEFTVPVRSRSELIQALKHTNFARTCQVPPLPLPVRSRKAA